MVLGLLGDLVEAGESAWRGLLDVLGLVIRRQAILWKSWRPWLAAFGLAFPGSLLLMGFSISVNQTYQRLIGPTVFKATGLTLGPGFTLLLCNVLLLICWSWTGGFVMGSVSRRVSAVLSFLPCVFAWQGSAWNRYRGFACFSFCYLRSGEFAAVCK